MVDAFSELIRGIEEAEQPIDFTPEYRLYYDKETGEDIVRFVTELNVPEPTGDYIVVTKDEWMTYRYPGKIVNEKLVYPSHITRYYRLVKDDNGEYGTKKNNPYFIGDEDHYSYERNYE